MRRKNMNTKVLLSSLFICFLISGCSTKIDVKQADYPIDVRDGVFISELQYKQLINGNSVEYSVDKNDYFVPSHLYNKTEKMIKLKIFD